MVLSNAELLLVVKVNRIHMPVKIFFLSPACIYTAHFKKQ